MVTLITRPMPKPFIVGATGAEREAKRQAWLAARLGPTPPTKETRQNFRAMLRKARKGVKA